jgi:hypothetical protein
MPKVKPPSAILFKERLKAAATLYRPLRTANRMVAGICGYGKLKNRILEGLQIRFIYAMFGMNPGVIQGQGIPVKETQAQLTFTLVSVGIQSFKRGMEPRMFADFHGFLSL